MQVSTSYNTTSLSVAGESAKVSLSAPTAPAGAPPRTDRVELSAAALEAQSASLSMSGVTTGKKGMELGFSLGIDYRQASFAAVSAEIEAGPEGASATLQTIAGEAKSTSFSFTMSSAAEGSGHLNDEVSKVSREIKPEVKEFLAAAGFKGGWGQVNRLLRSVA